MGAGNYLHQTYGHAEQFMIDWVDEDNWGAEDQDTIDFERDNHYYALLQDIQCCLPKSCEIFEIKENKWDGQCRVLGQNNSYKVLVTDNGNDVLVVVLETHMPEGDQFYGLQKMHVEKQYKALATKLIKNHGYSLRQRCGPWMSGDLELEDLA